MTAKINGYLKFNYDKVSSLRNIKLFTRKNSNGIPSDNQPELVLKLEMTSPVAVFDTAKNTKIITIGELFPLSGLICRLKLTNFKNNRTIEILLKPVDSRMYLNGYFFFSKKISDLDIEFLSSWRTGQTVSVSWRIEGYAILSKAFGGFDNLVLSIEAYSQDPLSIDTDTFVSNIIQPLGLSDKFVKEFFVTTPTTIQTPSKPLPKTVAMLVPPLTLFQSYLKNSLDIFRVANSISDYRSCMALIRTPLDSLLSLKNNSNFYIDLGKDLFTDTNIITDVSTVASGKGQAASEIIEDIWKKFQTLANINSKALHTTIHGASSHFEMKPEKPDAEFVLISCLPATNYLFERIQVL